MAFDQATRGRLQRFVNEARWEMEEEFSRQLQNDFGLDPISGAVTPLEQLRHLNDAQRETARILRETLAHYRSSEGVDEKVGLNRIVREQAFTVVNRLAALRMAEARGLIIESVGHGYQAKGFQLYARLAAAGLGDTGDAYRTYLFSTFDELVRDLPGLFDRYSPQGRLFPREAALQALLNLINHPEIEALWGEDETIGWIYQYFNSKEERKAMRDASQAPRNSRELAVRNQFFTPRYVVEFLVDNSLGRLWFNATGGTTRLRDRCQYLLIKPDEKQEPATRLRDPRTLKLLDPACGSMHFGLYAFDLFLEIYREAWDWEQAHGAGSLDTATQPAAGFKPLMQTYTDRDDFLNDVPRLIIEHNVYGVEIDPRSAQIASLALWLRAQRAWHDSGIKEKDRPLVGRGNVIAAIAPPSEPELRKAFTANLDGRDKELFEKTLQMLRGLPELGVLLRMDRELPHLIRQVFREHGPMYKDADTERWDSAEVRLRTALNQFGKAANSTYQGRLFAQDALEGLRLIDLVREKFDVILMNPPFGESSPNTTKYLKEAYQLGRPDLYMCFFLRCAKDLLRTDGFQGQITSRTFHTLEFFEPMRRELLAGDARLQVLADLGSGVLDAATVETSAYVVSRGLEESFYAFDLSTSDEKGQALVDELRAIGAGKSPKHVWRRSHSWFLEIPNGSLCYWLPASIKDAIKKFPQLDSEFACQPLVSNKRIDTHYAKVRQGLIPGDMFRFMRLRWEPRNDAVGHSKTWVPIVKGGEFRRYFSIEDWLFRWANDGSEAKAFAAERYGGASRTIKNESEYFKKGITFPRVSSVGINARLMPADGVFSDTGMAVIPLDDSKCLNLLGLCNSRFADMVCAVLHPGRKFEVAHVAALPVAESLLNNESLRELTGEIYGLVRSVTEKSAITERLVLQVSKERDIARGIAATAEDIAHVWCDVAKLQLEIDALVFDSYGISLDDRHFLVEYIDRLRGDQLAGPEIEAVLRPEKYSPNSEDRSELIAVLASQLIGHLVETTAVQTVVGEASGRRDVIDDLASRVLKIAEETLGIAQSNFDEQIASFTKGKPFSDYLLSPSDYFEDHLRSFTISPRKAPILWPISSSSGRFLIWIYYPDLHSQTLFRAVNDFVEPKLKQVSGRASQLRSKGGSRNRAEEREFEELESLEVELTEVRDSLLKIAQNYHPNQDDGVQITAAPLWPLFRHKPWQKVLKDTFGKLEKGEYDWAHLAMSYWPERVREKCKTDKSLAIAHGLEDLYVEPAADAKKKRGKQKTEDDE